MVVPNDLLDLKTGQRQARFRFTLLDQYHSDIGIITPGRDSAPSMENNMNRTVKRTMSGMVLLPDEARDIDMMRDQLKVEMLLSDNTVWPMGIFIFTDCPRPLLTWGEVLQPTMTDQTPIIDVPLPRAVVVPAGTNINAFIAGRLQWYNLPAGYELAFPTTITGSNPIVFPPGTTERSILLDLSSRAGCYSPYFDNYGVLQFRVPKDADGTAEPDHIYNVREPNSRVVANSVVYSTDVLAQPNRWIVTDTSAVDTPIVGYYDLPDLDPNSAINRGRMIVEEISIQSIGTVANATAVAKAAGTSARTAETLSFDSIIDPRHETYDVVRVDGNYYREQSWTLRLTEGSEMSHELKRSYPGIGEVSAAATENLVITDFDGGTPDVTPIEDLDGGIVAGPHEDTLDAGAP